MTSDISVIRSYTFHIVYERIQVRSFAVIWGASAFILRFEGLILFFGKLYLRFEGLVPK